jgi:hypothetical protein
VRAFKRVTTPVFGQLTLVLGSAVKALAGGSRCAMARMTSRLQPVACRAIQMFKLWVCCTRVASSQVAVRFSNI